jgi:hypothetical protein
MSEENSETSTILYVHEFGFWTERFTSSLGEVSMKNMKE